MNNFNVDEIAEVIGATVREESSGYRYDETHNPDIMGVIYSLGRDAENEEEYQYAVQNLLQIFYGGTDAVRAYCILAFSLLAVHGFPLDREVIAPLVLQERKKAEGRNLGIIDNAIDDMKSALGWYMESDVTID